MSIEFLRSRVSGIDDDMIEYALSLVDDATLEEAERIELLAEFLSGVNGVSDMLEIACEFSRIRKEEISNKAATAALQSTDAVVSACLGVIRAPKTRIETKTEPVDEDLKKEILRRYEGDISDMKPKGVKKIEKEASSDEEEIMGLGRNENKMRIKRERDEMRARAKQEQEEAHASKVAQKLKTQGDTIRNRSLGGRKK
jgi:hypothetical protein